VSAATGRILVADDTALNRSILDRALRSQGHEVVEAENGRIALEILRAAGGPPIDIVLLDIEMPEMDGYETLRQIKADRDLRDLPVIVISAVDELASVVRCIEMGAADYLPKPFEGAILRARVEASLTAKRLRDAERGLLQTIERQRTELARFLSPQVGALISSADGEALLAGHRRPVTAVFCDLRGFTPFSEAAEPEEVLGVLRDYHRAMGEEIVAKAGTLEHFAGDGMLVFFNDPIEQPDHVARAVRMAVAMRRRFEALRPSWPERGRELGFGVGIAEGHATMGRIGFEGRYDYAAVGTVVIMASRLSSDAASGQILLNRRAFAAVQDLVDGRSVGDLGLKGFSRPVPVFEVLDLVEPATRRAGGVRSPA